MKILSALKKLTKPSAVLAVDAPFSGSVDKYNQAIFGSNPTNDLTTIGGIISAVLPYVFVVAGIILFFQLIWGGLNLLTAAGSADSAEKGKKQITSSVFGFIIIFASYWVIQILQVVLGVNILSN
jgi:hypothetical protein